MQEFKEWLFSGLSHIYQIEALQLMLVNFIYLSSSHLWRPSRVVLAPLLFSLYMLPLGSIFKKHNVSFHCYADDTQIYLPLQQNNKNVLTPILECLNDIKGWMSLKFFN